MLSLRPFVTLLAPVPLLLKRATFPWPLAPLAALFLEMVLSYTCCSAEASCEPHQMVTGQANWLAAGCDNIESPNLLKLFFFVLGSPNLRIEYFGVASGSRGVYEKI